MKKLILITSVILLSAFGNSVFSQDNLSEIQKTVEQLKQFNESVGHTYDVLAKKIDDLLWYQKVGDIAYIDKVYLYGPPRPKRVIDNPTAMGADNPLKFWCYIFIPKDIDQNKEYPLIVFPHSGVHADFSTYYAHIVRELVAQQYIVVSAEYRGSTGYGQDFYENIDYGALENEDVEASRKHMIENYPFVDENRTGIIGWSHGGMISLMSIFTYPDKYKVAFAGVPVSDMVTRMGYSTDSYRKLFSADYHIGKTAREDIEEYKRRSPTWNAHKLKTPLLIHTNTNDDDVFVTEVETLIKALKAEGKKFEYEIFQNSPGGHSFDRIDTKEAKEIRVKIYKFLDKYLDPPKKINSVRDIDRAAYFMK